MRRGTALLLAVVGQAALALLAPSVALPAAFVTFAGAGAILARV